MAPYVANDTEAHVLVIEITFVHCRQSSRSYQ